MVIEPYEHAMHDDLRDRVLNPLVEEESKVLVKNQVTVPSAVVKALGIKPGDRLVWVLRRGETDQIHLRRIRSDYAGALAGVYGSPEDMRAYLREEQEAWDD